jgi:AcrR family transcriptional regulator
VSTSKRYHHGDLRQALIDRARALVEREGLASLTLRRLGADVGVSHAAVYRHFKDKQALVGALAFEAATEMRAAMQAALAGHRDPVRAFHAFGVAYVMYAVEHTAQFRTIFGGGADAADARLADAKEETMGMILAGVEACQHAGVLPAGPVEPLAAAAWSLMHGLATLTIDGVLTRTGLPAIDPGQSASMVLATMTGYPGTNGL